MAHPQPDAEHEEADQQADWSKKRGHKRVISAIEVSPCRCSGLMLPGTGELGEAQVDDE
jgi:hypothetical protein